MNSIGGNDNFDRAGAIWMKIWTTFGLTCLSLENSKVRISKTKIFYCTFIICALAMLTYFRYTMHTFDKENIISSIVQVYTASSSLICSAIMVILSILNIKKEASVLTGLILLRKKYLIRVSRSMMSYFPASCIIPCSILIIENMLFAILHYRYTLIGITSYCFSVYSFTFYGQVLYYMTMVEDAFRQLNENIRNLEINVSRDSKDLVRELRGLRLMYHELFNYSAEVNKFFSSRIILTVGQNFAVTVLYMFNGIVEVVHPRATKPPIPIILFYWAFCCSLVLYLLVQPCERIKNVANFTVIAIQSLSIRPGHNKAVYNELRLFSCQLVLQRIRFMHNDFLIMDKPMLLSSFSTISSFLTILLQLEFGIA